MKATPPNDQKGKQGTESRHSKAKKGQPVTGNQFPGQQAYQNEIVLHSRLLLCVIYKATCQSNGVLTHERQSRLNILELKAKMRKNKQKLPKFGIMEGGGGGALLPDIRLCGPCNSQESPGIDTEKLRSDRVFQQWCLQLFHKVCPEKPFPVGLVQKPNIPLLYKSNCKRFLLVDFRHETTETYVDYFIDYLSYTKIEQIQNSNTQYCSEGRPCKLLKMTLNSRC